MYLCGFMFVTFVHEFFVVAVVGGGGGMYCLALKKYKSKNTSRLRERKERNEADEK